MHLPDAGVWFVGDVLEESGPPMYSSGSFPLDWPATVGRLRAALGDRDVLVPGHGAVIDTEFAAGQQSDLQTVADLISELHAAGVPAAGAVDEAGDRWPFPAEGMHGAVRDGYRQLGLP